MGCDHTNWQHFFMFSWVLTIPLFLFIRFQVKHYTSKPKDLIYGINGCGDCGSRMFSKDSKGEYYCNVCKSNNEVKPERRVMGTVKLYGITGKLIKKYEKVEFLEGESEGGHVVFATKKNRIELFGDGIIEVVTPNEDKEFDEGDD